MKKVIAVVMILAFVGTIFVAVPLVTYASPKDDLIRIDAADTGKNLSINDGIETAPPPTHHSYYSIGAVATWPRYNFAMVGYGLSTYTLRGISPHAEIWVQNNMAWPAGDTRPYPTITPAEIAYFLNEFETIIYPTDVAYFGAPAYRDGIFQVPGWGGPWLIDDSGMGRTMIKIENIRDTNYYTPSYPYYIAGYFSSTIGIVTDRNVVSIDTWRWERRLGPYGTVWVPPDFVDRPYVYDSTLTHEFQHLIHADWNPGDPSFMNEGCSMYAEYLCGYGIDPTYINSYMATPDNSLTEWGDQGDINILADYGESALWSMYLGDHYGASFLSYFVQTGIPGIDGINNALNHFAYVESFFDVFTEWKLANLIHSGTGKCNYFSLNLDDYDPIRLYSLGGLPVTERSGTDFGNTITVLGYDTGISMIAPWGSDYIQFTDWGQLVCLFTKVLGGGYLYFDGDNNAQLPPPTLWTYSLPDGWFSGTGVDLADEYLAGNSYVNPLDPTLTIETKYDLEEFWDFGFVRVSTDGGQHWTSLANAYTTPVHDPAAHPKVVASLPGFTGDSLGTYPPSWITMDFDLTAYSGQTVMIGFRYVTDWAIPWDGWWIRSATVCGTPLSLMPAVFPPAASFHVSVIQAVVTGSTTSYSPYDMMLTDPANKGMTVASACPPDYVILIVTPTATEGLSDYKFQATNAPLPGFFP
jgi:hypothetical protein